MGDPETFLESADGDSRGGTPFLHWLVGLAAVIAVLVVALLTIGPALQRARADARKAVLKQRLHSLSLALAFYRQEEAAYPPDLQTLASYKNCLGQCRLSDFDVGQQKVQYVIPQSDDPNEAMLYHWPPFDGGTWVLYQNRELDWVKPAPDGALVNPRTGAVIRPGGTPSGEAARPPAQAATPQPAGSRLDEQTSRPSPIDNPPGQAYELWLYDVTDILVDIDERAAGASWVKADTAVRAAHAEEIALLIKQACGEGTWRNPGVGSDLAREATAISAGDSGRAGPRRQGRLFILPEDPQRIMIVQTARVHECIRRFLQERRQTGMVPGPHPLPNAVGTRWTSGSRLGNTPEDREVYSLLRERVALRFDAVPLRQVVEFLQDTTGADFTLRMQDLPADGAPVTLATDGKLEAALDRIGELTGMVWVVDAGVVNIGSPTSILVHERRMYDVGDLLVVIECSVAGGGPARPWNPMAITASAEHLLLLITRDCGHGNWTILPAAHETAAAEGAPPEQRSARPGWVFVVASSPDTIIVAHTPGVHREIEALLKEMRAAVQVEVQCEVTPLVFTRGDAPAATDQSLPIDELAAHALWHGEQAPVTLVGGRGNQLPGLGVELRAAVAEDLRRVFVDVSGTGDPLLWRPEAARMFSGHCFRFQKDGTSARALAGHWMGQEAWAALGLEDCVVALVVRPQVFATWGEDRRWSGIPSLPNLEGRPSYR